MLSKRRQIDSLVKRVSYQRHQHHFLLLLPTERIASAKNARSDGKDSKSWCDGEGENRGEKCPHEASESLREDDPSKDQGEMSLRMRRRRKLITKRKKRMCGNSWSTRDTHWHEKSERMGSGEINQINVKLHEENGKKRYTIRGFQKYRWNENIRWGLRDQNRWPKSDSLTLLTILREEWAEDEDEDSRRWLDRGVPLLLNEPRRDDLLHRVGWMEESVWLSRASLTLLDGEFTADNTETWDPGKRIELNCNRFIVQVKNRHKRTIWILTKRSLQRSLQKPRKKWKTNKREYLYW